MRKPSYKESEAYARERIRIGNTPLCEVCDKDFDHCECEQDEKDQKAYEENKGGSC